MQATDIIGTAITLPAGFKIGMGKLSAPHTGTVDALEYDSNGAPFYRVLFTLKTGQTRTAYYKPGTTPAIPELEEIEDNDALCWEDGLTDEEIEEGRAELEKFAAKELAAAKTEVSQIRRDQREHFLSTGMDIVDYVSLHADSPEAADQLASELGYKSVTWNDRRNAHRRETAKRRTPSILSKSATKAAVKHIEARQAEAEAAPDMTAFKAAAAPVPYTPREAAQPVAPAQPTEPAPEPAPAPREFASDAQQRVVGYYNNLIESHPDRAAKLRASLAWQLSEYDKYAERVNIWEMKAVLAAQAKIR